MKEEASTQNKDETNTQETSKKQVPYECFCSSLCAVVHLLWSAVCFFGQCGIRNPSSEGGFLCLLSNS
ncbi:hypothetical protein LR48_Vigan01g188700 [Vigna angularis]|uniref:Uncharacterized protein n=1 Tax=Phaseolus angularis TaxID=3914 RepID=A0A0L9TPD3_PHAAN|nr:hypothetical protein LR48_Vigan01g188700 [Vigna angularis]